MPTRRIELSCATLSPLWTGGAGQTIDRIHETGILGSMRWWFEALLRGVGAEACDPAGNNRHIHNPDAPPYYGLCPACEVFGATGWRRRFRLTVRETDLQPEYIGNIRANRAPNPHNNDKVPTWYFAATRKGRRLEPRRGGFTLVLDNLDGRTDGAHFNLEVIAGLLQFMVDWAGIGARNQMGFGRFRIDGPRLDTRPLYDYLDQKRGAHHNGRLPSLGNSFFAVVAPPTNERREAFNLKHDLRQLFRGFPGDRDLRHCIMGTTDGDGITAKVKMDWPINREMRVWGWLPSDPASYPAGWNRDRVADTIHGELQANWRLRQWHEVNSPRNTHLPATTDIDAFLRFLLHQEDHP